MEPYHDGGRVARNLQRIRTEGKTVASHLRAPRMEKLLFCDIGATSPCRAAEGSLIIMYNTRQLWTKSAALLVRRVAKARWAMFFKRCSKQRLCIVRQGCPRHTQRERAEEVVSAPCRCTRNPRECLNPKRRKVVHSSPSYISPPVNSYLTHHVLYLSKLRILLSTSSALETPSSETCFSTPRSAPRDKESGRRSQRPSFCDGRERVARAVGSSAMSFVSAAGPPLDATWPARLRPHAL